MSILDASAVIALLEREPGHQVVADIIVEGASISTVNLAEVGTRLLRKGMPADRAAGMLTELPLIIVDVTLDLAIEAALLWTLAKHFGLSLGDRICLALAKREGRAAVTADRKWAEAASDIGAQVLLFR